MSASVCESLLSALRLNLSYKKVFRTLRKRVIIKTIFFTCIILHYQMQPQVREHCVFCTVTAFVHPPGPCPAQPLCSMSTAHSSHSNGLVAHTHTQSSLPLWRLFATVQKTLCFKGSSIQVPETCSCVKLMGVTLLCFWLFIKI